MNTITHKRIMERLTEIINSLEVIDYSDNETLKPIETVILKNFPVALTVEGNADALLIEGEINNEPVFKINAFAIELGGFTQESQNPNNNSRNLTPFVVSRTYRIFHYLDFNEFSGNQIVENIDKLRIKLNTLNDLGFEGVEKSLFIGHKKLQTVTSTTIQGDKRFVQVIGCELTIITREVN